MGETFIAIKPLVSFGYYFMAVSSQSSEPKEALRQYMPDNFAEIIDKLTGEKDNLRVDVQEVRFCIGDTRYEVGGTVNVNVKHKNNRHWMAQK